MLCANCNDPAKREKELADAGEKKHNFRSNILEKNEQEGSWAQSWEVAPPGSGSVPAAVPRLPGAQVSLGCSARMLAMSWGTVGWGRLCPGRPGGQIRAHDDLRSCDCVSASSGVLQVRIWASLPAFITRQVIFWPRTPREQRHRWKFASLRFPCLQSHVCKLLAQTDTACHFFWHHLNHSNGLIVS